jgi:hypothetical protein
MVYPDGKAGAGSDEERVREWLDAVLEDIGCAGPGLFVREHVADGYPEAAPVCHIVAGALSGL